MRSTDATGLVAALALVAAAPAAAQAPAQGFAVERLVLAPPGSGWVVASDLRQEGAIAVSASSAVGWARRPLEVGGLQVVRDQAFATLGLAVTWDRLRVHAALGSPLRVAGRSGSVDGWTFAAPGLSVESNPDTLSDAELGVEARLAGVADGPARLGIGARLFIPSGRREDYVTDGTWRGMLLLLAAGDAGRWEWAAQTGAHLRTLDEASPQAPRGSELLAAAAAGTRLPLLGRDLVVGPELSGASAFRAFLGSDTTALEALLTARWEGPRAAPGLRLKLAGGAGLHARFGAPAWRVAAVIEATGRP